MKEILIINSNDMKRFQSVSIVTIQQWSNNVNEA